MASSNVIILLRYDGHLRIEDDIPIYDGGKRKPIRVPLSSTLDNLMTIIHRVTEYNCQEFQLKLTYKYSGKECTAIKVVDDES